MQILFALLTWAEIGSNLHFIALCHSKIYTTTAEKFSEDLNTPRKLSLGNFTLEDQQYRLFSPYLGPIHVASKKPSS
jgi:hypothetical protein